MDTKNSLSEPMRFVFASLVIGLAALLGCAAKAVPTAALAPVAKPAARPSAVARTRSPGCDKPAKGTDTYEPRTLTIRGVEREYFLWVPGSYDSSKAYPLIFRWHGSGGNGTSGGLPIEAAAEGHAIVASPSGIKGRWDLSPDGADIDLFDTLLKELRTQLCVDEEKIFSFGFSMGGMMSNLLGCIRANVMRAVAPVAGAPPRSECSGQVAAWVLHSPEDTVVKPAAGQAARDRYIKVNGCDPNSPADPDTRCTRYKGCSAAFPVVWCEVDGGHNPKGDVSAPGAWAFFKSLPPRS